MKHWNELSELESEIIRVGEFKNLFKLLVAGSENYVDIKVLQSAIYTMETMIDDIDSKLYEKFETAFNAVRDEDAETEGAEKEFEFDFSTMNDHTGSDGHRHADVDAYRFENGQPFVYKKRYKAENKSTTSVEEDEAFKDLEKAIRNWKPTAP